MTASSREIADARRSPRDGFVTVRGTELRLDGRSYHFVGANYWQAMNLASRGPGGDRQQLLRELDDMKAHGITNLRLMAASEGPDTEPLRIVPALLQAPGVYNADLLDGLDFALKALADRDMKAIMTLGNMWHWSGGLGQYVVWAGLASSIPYPPPHPGGDWDQYQRFTAQFYGNARAVSYYLDHVTKIVTRVNHYTNRPYRDDPTIMAWELANEPRPLRHVDSYLAWIAAAAQLIKSLDHDHLVTIGSEGDTSDPGHSGTEYLRDHSLSAIDYGTAHVWVQNWGWYDPLAAATTYAPAVALAKAYIDSHVSRTRELGKPIVFEEFGIARDLGSFSPASPVTVRDRYYAELLGHLHALADSPAVAGANFWGYAGESRPVPPFGRWWRPGDALLADPPHEPQGWYSVYDSDASTLAVVEQFSRLMSDLDRPEDRHRAEPPPSGAATTARLIPELEVEDLDRSLEFYTGVLGFTVLYARPEERFVLLEREGANLMLEEAAGPGRRFHTAPLEHPFGRGVNFQIQVADAEALHASVLAARAQVVLPIEERWYRRDDHEIGHRQFVVADPDGYLLRLFTHLGRRFPG